MFINKQSHFSFIWRFTLLSLITGISVLIVSKSLDISDSALTIFVVFLIQLFVFSPLTYSNLARSKENQLYFLGKIKMSSEVEQKREFELIEGSQVTIKSKWFWILTGICAITTEVCAISVYLILLFPPVSAALALVYALWLTTRNLNIDGINKAMAWFRNIETMIVKPIMQLILQWKPWFAMAVVSTLMIVPFHIWPILRVINVIQDNLSSITIQQLFFLIALIFSIALWYVVELYLLIRLFKRLHYHYVVIKIPDIPIISLAVVPTVVISNICISTLLFVDPELFQNTGYIFKYGILAPIWGASGLTILIIWKRYDRYYLANFDEQIERRIWMSLFLLFSIILLVFANRIGYLLPFGMVFLYFLLFFVYGNIDFLMDRKLKKSDAVGNFLLHHIARWIFIISGLVLIFLFIKNTSGAIPSTIITTILGVIFLVSGSIDFTHDINAHWANRKDSNISNVIWEILVDNGFIIWVRGFWKLLIFNIKNTIRQLR